jgi:hypothetical protein
MQKKKYLRFLMCHARYVLFSTRGYVVFQRGGAQLLEIYLETALEVDEEMYLCIVLSSLAATSARGVFQSNFPRIAHQSDADWQSLPCAN